MLGAVPIMQDQIQWIHLLHKIRSPVLDALIRFCNYLDRPEFFLFLIPVVWLGINWRFGIRLFYILSLSHLVNHILKAFLACPRPFNIEPALGLIEVEGYGCPSGAAQNGLLLAGILIVHWKSAWRWPIGLGYLLLISFSRVYLGVHFPSDILVGWLVGALLLAIYCFVFPKIEAWLRTAKPFHAFVISQCLLLLILACLPYSMLVTICGSALGFGLGIFINQSIGLELEPPVSLLEFFVRIAIGIAGIIVIVQVANYAELESSMALYLEFAAIGFWVSFCAPLVCYKLTAH